MRAIQWFSGRERMGRIFNQRTWTSQVKFPINVGYRRTSNAVTLERFDALWNAFYYTNNESVVGDFLEFGVARGRSMVFAWNALHSFKPDIPQPRFYGFDSFSGFPAATGVDAVFERFKAGQEDHGGEVVARAVLRRNGIADSDVTLVPGFYADTLTEENRKSLGIERARVVHLDCDMLMSTKLALDFLSPALQSGTVLLFDDFFCYRADPRKGEAGALAAFAESNPDFHFTPYRTYANVGKAFIVTRLEGAPEASTGKT